MQGMNEDIYYQWQCISTHEPFGPLFRDKEVGMAWREIAAFPDGRTYTLRKVGIPTAAPAKHNPKHIQAQKEGKTPFRHIPWKALAQIARALDHGAAKYGEKNWRVDPILSMTYVESIARHALEEWATGTDVDKDSGLHPLAHVAAACLIVLDAIEQGTLIDDRDRKESKEVTDGPEDGPSSQPKRG